MRPRLLNPDKVLVVRLTAQWVPGRADIQKAIQRQGKKDGRIGAQNAWPVDMLKPGHVYVCDHFGLKQDGPSIGDTIGNSIFARSRNGIVYDVAVRDINGLKELEDFTSSSGPTTLPITSVACQRATQFHHGRHQRSDPHREGHRDAGGHRAG